MAFDITTFCETDWKFYDDIRSATFEPVDAAGSLGDTYAVKVLYGQINKPQAFGGRIALPGTHTVFTFWKALSTSAPDPKPQDLLTVDSITYVLDGVTDTRRSKWEMSATQVRTNSPVL